MTSRKERAAQFAEEGYKLHVTGRNVMVTEAMKNYALEKVAKIERISNRIIDVHIIMDIQRFEHRVDIMMKVGHLLIKSHAAGDDMYAVIDKASDKLQRQLRRYKRRLQDHTARPLEVVDMRVNVYKGSDENEIDEVNDAIEEENMRRIETDLRPHEIVAKETMPLKMLTLNECIMKMDLSGDHFLLFKDEADRKLKLIYRRSDGNYGLIHPEA